MLYKPSAQEVALLLQALVRSKEDERRSKGEAKPLTRFRVSDRTLEALARRRRLESGFLNDVRDFLLDAGWALVLVGSTYALIRTDIADGWVRLSFKRIQSILDQVDHGLFDFDELEKQLGVSSAKIDDGEQGADE